MTRNELRTRPRRIVLQEDCMLPNSWADETTDIHDWIERRFEAIGTDSAVDTIIWDIGLESHSIRIYTRGSSVPFIHCPLLQRWAGQGIDVLDECLAAARRRGIESWWNHRISEADVAMPPSLETDAIPWDSPTRHNRVRAAHPEWRIDCWWPQGMWNMANPEQRAAKLNILRELLADYDLDGLIVDFTRHTPFLPPGREEELHGHVTGFMTELRRIAEATEQRRQRPLLLGAKVAENVAGNRFDGLALEEWSAAGLVDVLIAGGRTAAIDFAGFRALPGSERITLIPMFDGHHTDAGAHRADAPYLRGIFANWQAAGATAIGLFNWCFPEESTPEARRYAAPQQQMLREPGDPEALRRGPKAYMVETRGEYPWAGNYIYRNDDKPLPMVVAHGAGAIFSLPIAVPVPPPNRLDLQVEKLAESDELEVTCNGIRLDAIAFDADGFNPHFGFWIGNAPNRFPTRSFAVPPEAIQPGDNRIAIRFDADRHPVLFTIVQVRLWTAPETIIT